MKYSNKKGTGAMKIPAIFILAAILPAGGVGAVYGEEAALVPEKTLRLSVAPSFGFQVQEWYDEAESAGKVMVFNTGAALEYGVTGWLTAQALWIPGINLWSDMKWDTEPDPEEKYGLFMDPFLGLKIGILGEDALIEDARMRFSLAAGVKAPMAATEAWEGDRHLWGSSLRAYYDYVVTPLYYLNLYLELVYFPEQWTDNPNYSSRTVDHPLEITMELDNRFRYPLDGGDMVLHWGVPLTYSIAPWADRNQGDEGMKPQYSFSLGAFFMLSFVKMALPFDLSLRYAAPLSGKNEQPIQRVTLMGRVYITNQ
jgi:hypothetical protein